MIPAPIQKYGRAAGLCNGLQEKSCRRTIVRITGLKNDRRNSNMQRTVLSLIVITGLLLSGVPAMAHHAFATEFDAQKPISMKGIVTKIDWANPHVWFYVNVKTDSGVIENWG